ncbi:hypothetical protein LTR10_018061 [Elasticomyces elasticus]|uniref:Uncharacterized protein n=1 Tax=Exophiala sideris TaxID=1016849 RepID=A0ABR0JPL9_9EURO|nr:hypothetical protein LTR10_018061 [Elasticomyces elasticus]KAK5039535.1 hypothetical protein LTS07_000029 [Exophiala sideris]KAK5041088.1 hypothetical protein LTR13_002562 [Exophiala sideris]KAK5067912.1 hypothetical protein LTR69_000029 [Exophiala sideris]KAK5187214.1 hypothetical protein LTR44_000029 [Eurotiomycetes sp. CCFEE 6388]
MSGSVVREVPVSLDSVEAIRFLGFQKEAAEQILHHFRAAYEKEGKSTTTDPLIVYDLVSFATGHLEGRADAWLPDHDWEGSLKAMGIRKSTRQGICSNKFNFIRFTKSGKAWARETIEDTWIFLSTIDKNIKSSREPTPKKTGPEEKTYFKVVASDNSVPSRGNNIPLEPYDTPPDYSRVRFYMGGPRARFERAWPALGTTALRLQELLSTSASDFTPDKLNLYFTKQFTVATAYAMYAKARTPLLDCGVLTVQIPNELVNNIGYVEGVEWKDLVWVCRHERPLNPDVHPIIKQWAKFSWIEGECCGQSPAVIEALEKKEDLEVLREHNGYRYRQWALRDEAIMAQMSVECAEHFYYHSVD